jgi:caffeoyl-CoA O-methyltransferase
MEMTPDRWRTTGDYLDRVFGRPDDHLARLMERAVEAGLPDIAVSASVGRMLMLLAGMSGLGGRGPRRALEIGTLAGYSGIWIARGLGEGGRLITLEPEARHADFAERAFRDAGVADRVEVRQTPGLEELPRLVEEFGEGAFDFIFIDAIKTEYCDYFPWCARLLTIGGILTADNVLGGGSWWLDEAENDTGNASRAAVDRFNRLVATDPRFETACVPIREGVLIARKVSDER